MIGFSGGGSTYGGQASPMIMPVVGDWTVPPDYARSYYDKASEKASPGYYMCSYALERAGQPLECHIMQARWTPRQASTITVTLAGRTARCGSLREAIASLR